MNNSVDISEIQVEEVNEENLASAELIKVQGLVQTKTRYQTAVQVIKKRNLPEVINRVENEAALSGEDFYYSYPQGGKYIEGVGINGALILARNWGNNAVEVRPYDLGDKYILIGDFVDFETGFNLSRPFLLKKKVLKNKSGNAIYDKERNDEIVFQIGTSKAMRNVILNAIPNYVSEAGIKKAKEGYRKKLEEYIKKNGIDKAREMLVKRAERLNVPIERIELNFGKSTIWDIDKILLISGALKGIEEGYHTVNDAFPKGLNEEEKKEEQVNSVDEQKADKLEVEKAEIVEEQKVQKQQNENQQIKNSEVKTDGILLVEERKEKNVLSPEDWESPEKICEVIKSINNINDLRKFKKENKARLEAFGGSDREKIVKALIECEQKFIKK